jgi:four helix bundle protein
MVQLTHRLPQSWANAVIARQIITAATSVGANIAEGHGRYTPGAHGNHLEIAKGSAAETDSWADILRREGHISAEKDAAIHAACLEVMLLLKIKILDLEKLEPRSNRRIRETAADYMDGEANDAPPFPFTVEDYI